MQQSATPYVKTMMSKIHTIQQPKQAQGHHTTKSASKQLRPFGTPQQSEQLCHQRKGALATSAPAAPHCGHPSQPCLWPVELSSCAAHICTKDCINLISSTPHWFYPHHLYLHCSRLYCNPGLVSCTICAHQFFACLA